MTVGNQILDEIRKNPGITVRELSERLGKRVQHINNECGALENTKKIIADRSLRPYQYYAEEDRPQGTIISPVKIISQSPYFAEFDEIIQDVTAAVGRRIDSNYEIIDRGIPHVPHTLKQGKMGIYTFLYQDEFLKIGKAGPHSNARFFSQHYLPSSARSNLSKSILEDDRMRGLGITADNVGDWIKQNTRRIDILFDVSLGIFTLELIEATFHYKYEPRYEGYQNQR